MDFSIPSTYIEDRDRFRSFLDKALIPHMSQWYRQGAVPRDFFLTLADGGWFDYEINDGVFQKRPALRCALLSEEMAAVSPGIALTALVHSELGIVSLWLFGSDALKKKYGQSAIEGKTLMCLGNSESGAGSDAAGIAMAATPVDGGWVLNGTKAYVTNGLISDLGAVTAVSDPKASRNRRISMFLVDLNDEGVKRTKLKKQVWMPSDLTRIQFTDVFVPEDHLLGIRGNGLQQVLKIFTYSRVSVAALTMGTAKGAFDMALEHGKRRRIFGSKILDFQAKAFEVADFYAKMEAARLMLWKACWKMDEETDFRLESSLAKYLAVEVARNITGWAADVFGAASVMPEHPIHKFPLDAWGSALGEGTQDVQKLVIFRELLKKMDTDQS